LGIGITILILVGGILLLNDYVKNKIRQGLEKEFSSLSYDEVSVNVLKGNVSVSNITFIEGEFSVGARELRVIDFHYTNYFFGDKVIIGKVELKNPKITLNISDTTKANDKGQEKKNIDLKIKTFRIYGGNFRKVENDSASNSLFMLINSVVLDDLVYQSKNTEGSPLQYGQVNFETDSIYFDLNAEHFLTVKKVKRQGGNLAASKVKMIPKYNRNQFDRKIQYEKDRVDLNIDSIFMRDFNWETIDKDLILKSPVTHIDKAQLNIYRNKLLPDDQRNKPLYGRMLREMGLKIKFDSISINNSRIVYEEKLNTERPPAKIHLDKMKLTIKNLTNLLSDSIDSKKTVLIAEGNFMGEGVITFNYDFEVQNQQDQFHIQGKLGSISADAVNPFLRPAMGIEIEGNIESVFFNFQGNNFQATGDMQLAYNNFKVHVLKEGERKEKSLLSGIANLFIKSDVINEKVSQKNVSVERDQTKSFWNYLWLLIEKGALKTLI
jgi:hypothetical protein